MPTAWASWASTWCGGSRAIRSPRSFRPWSCRAATTPSEIQQWFAAGADEIFTGVFPPAEQRARLDALLVRTQRDVSVHPSTRMPGTTEIEREIRRRLEGDSPEFAVCYADLDHFKEYNDRYSYYDGDRVIYILSRILHDVVKGLLGSQGFVGHIGGDDFIFIIPAAEISLVCGEMLSGVRYAGAVSVQRAGSAGRLFFREGPARPAPSGSPDDALGRHRHQPPPDLRPPGRSERAGHRNEELRQDASRLGLRRRPAPEHGRAGRPSGSAAAREGVGESR